MGRLLSKDRIGGVLLFAFCLTYGLLGQEIPLLPAQQDAVFNPRTLPNFLAVAGVGLSLLLVLFPPTQAEPQLAGLRWMRLVSFLALMSLYGLGIRPLGFVVATSLFLAGGFALLGERSWLKLLGVATGIAVLFWALMDLGLGVFIDPLPGLMSAVHRP